MPAGEDSVKRTVMNAVIAVNIDCYVLRPFNVRGEEDRAQDFAAIVLRAKSVHEFASATQIRSLNT